MLCGEIREKIEKLSVGREDLKSLFDTVHAQLLGYVSHSIPVYPKRRLQVLDELKRKVDSGLVSSYRGLLRLWNYIEDEKRLTQENTLFEQSITLDGAQRRVHMAKLGMVALYYKTLDGQVGMARKSPRGWEYVSAESGEHGKLILSFFDGLKKQVRTGHYRLPLSQSEAL